MSTDSQSIISPLSIPKPVYTAPSPAVILVGTLSGGFLAFVWGMIAWVVLGLHDNSINRIPNEQIVLQALENQLIDVEKNTIAPLKTGFYTYPAGPEQKTPDGKRAYIDAKSKAELTDKFNEKYAKGPIFQIVYRANGGSPMTLGVMFGGMMLQFCAAFVVSLVMYCSLGVAIYYWQRVTLGGLIAFFGGLSHLAMWNWMAYPWEFTIAMVIDLVVGWVLVSMFLANLIAPRAVIPEPQPASTIR